MSFLLELMAPLAAALSVPPGALVFMLLILAGALGHVVIYRSVRRLTMAADKTETRWDDVVLYAVFPPIQWVMWTVLGLLSLSLFRNIYQSLINHGRYFFLLIPLIIHQFYAYLI